MVEIKNMELHGEYRDKGFHQAGLGLHSMQMSTDITPERVIPEDKGTPKRAIMYVPSLQSSSQLPVS